MEQPRSFALTFEIKLLKSLKSLYQLTIWGELEFLKPKQNTFSVCLMFSFVALCTNVKGERKY